MELTAELIDNRIGETQFRYDLLLIVTVVATDGHYAVSITIRDPWAYKDISRTKYVREVPTDSDYGPMIVHILKFEHPNIIFMWEYDNMTRRITIKTVPNYIRSKYGTTIAPPSWHEKSKENKTMRFTFDNSNCVLSDPFIKWEYDNMTRRITIKTVPNYIRSKYGTTIAPPSWHEKSKENKTMRFTKVVVNGPATIAWVTTGRNPSKKVIIKKADGDIYDLEKAMLMCWAKSWFSDDTDFHKWFKLNMKMFEEAYDKDHPDIGELPVVDAKAISENINATLDRMSKKLREYKEKINNIYGKAAVGDNIVNKKDDKKINRWSEDEVILLKRHYKDSSMSDIAAALGRSEASVKAKAHRLGLDKKEE